MQGRACTVEASESPFWVVQGLRSRQAKCRHTWHTLLDLLVA
jgi:hypothetical protein